MSAHESTPTQQIAWEDHSLAEDSHRIASKGWEIWEQANTLEKNAANILQEEFASSEDLEVTLQSLPDGIRKHGEEEAKKIIASARKEAYAELANRKGLGRRPLRTRKQHMNI